MKLVIRIYKRWDYDLMLLCSREQIQLNECGKRAIISFFNQDSSYTIQVSEPKNNDALPKCLAVCCNISDNDAPGVIKWLKQFTYGERNTAIKNMIRYYLKGQNIYAFIDSNTTYAPLSAELTPNQEIKPEETKTTKQPEKIAKKPKPKIEAPAKEPVAHEEKQTEPENDEEFNIFSIFDA